ncbi:MAG: hypothetical protein FWG92_06505 [Leptospirales bacterium]|nr:hypothetical protein [Leptospirales bacterium]
MKTKTTKTNMQQKAEAYEKYFAAAGKLIHSGNISAALPRAQEGFELGIELARSECAGQYLFCLNKLGRFDEAIRATERYMAQAKNVDETVLSNALCATLSFGHEKVSSGLSLLKKSGLSSVKDWRLRFANLDYNPSQTSLIFNTALIFLYAGQKTNALKLLKEVLEHLTFILDSEYINAEIVDEFMRLISEIPEFAPLREEDVWNELTGIMENIFETT